MPEGVFTLKLLAALSPVKCMLGKYENICHNIVWSTESDPEMDSLPANYDKETNVLIYTDRCSIQKGWLITACYLTCVFDSEKCVLCYKLPPFSFNEEEKFAVGGFLSEAAPEDESTHIAVFLLSSYKAIDLTISSRMLMCGALITLHPLISASQLCICSSYQLYVLHVCSTSVYPVTYSKFQRLRYPSSLRDWWKINQCMQTCTFINK